MAHSAITPPASTSDLRETLAQQFADILFCTEGESHPYLARGRTLADAALASFSTERAALCERVEKAERKLNCPIGIPEDSRSICSAGTCWACLADRCVWSQEQIEKAAESRIAALAPDSQGADAGRWRPPEGWRLVPEEPTEAMAKASRLTTNLPNGDYIHEWGVNAWAAMLAAAPIPPGEDR